MILLPQRISYVANNSKPQPIEDMFDDLTTKQKMIALGSKLIDMIKKRTMKGMGVDGRFSPYSDQRVTRSGKKYEPYWLKKKRNEFKRQAAAFRPNSPKDVNLVLTGDLLNSFQVKRGGTNDSQVTIGFPPAESRKAFKQEALGRAISLPQKPVNSEEEEFIASFFDKQIKKAFKDASGRTELIIG